MEGKETNNQQPSPDPEEFAAEGNYLWRVTYPILLVGFYLVLLLGWLFLSWKVWGIFLLTLYILMGLANYFYVIVPGSVFRREGPLPRGFLHSVLITPVMLIFFPIIHLFTIILLMRTTHDSEKHKKPPEGELQTECSGEERAHGIGWKIYFVIFIIFAFLSTSPVFFLENPNPINIMLKMLHLFMSVSVLYSWIWARRIRWLSYVRWLIMLWSIQFFIAPIALVVHGYLVVTKGDPESINWIITIAINYPALYAVYRIAWKSRLLHKPMKEALIK